MGSTGRWALVVFLLTLGTGVVAADRAAPPKLWETSYAVAQARARKLKRPLLLEFFADWCGPCKKMEQTTFTDREVQTLLKRFVPVRLNLDRERALSRRYAVESIPHVLVLGPDGRVLREGIGYQDASAFRLFLLQALPN